MLVKEFHIIFPLTLDQYKIGQLYTTLQTSKKESNNGSKVQFLENSEIEKWSIYP